VGPCRDDGYHPVRSLMVELAGLADRLTIRPAARRAVRCPGLDGPGNLAWAALDALERASGRALPCEVEIEKRIPARAGLGGGSSDAAAVLVGADRLFRLGLGTARLEAIAAEVGSDVPFFVRGGCQWAEGRGERLTPARAPGFAAVVLAPSGGLSTGAVYAAFDRLPAPPPDDGAPPPPGGSALRGWVRNDLWPAALALAPALGRSARALAAAGADVPLLCGSGAAVAGLVVDVARAAEVAAALAATGARAVGPLHPADRGDSET
jgi:4-diphosphocytidyl-2-C-methyl-D-erythritol kinase